MSDIHAPCRASHTPKSLQNYAAEKIAMSMLRKCFSGDFNKLELNSYNSYFDMIFNAPANSHLNLDKILTTASNTSLGRDRAQLLECIKSVKHWWESPEVFGVMGSPFRALVHDAIVHILDQIDAFFKHPLLIFTLQLCFTNRAGFFTKPLIQMNSELPKRNCPPLSEFLESLAPFYIENFCDTSIIFGSPEPLIVIFQNSPQLKNIHLRNNSSDFVLTQIGLYCRKLRQIVIENILGQPVVSEEYLYKAFFNTMNKETVKYHIFVEQEKVELSFPSLQLLDVGKSSKFTEFLLDLPVFYDNIKSVSCDSTNFSLHVLSVMLKPIPDYKFTIRDLTIYTGTLGKENLKDLTNQFPNLSHVTLSADRMNSDKYELCAGNCNNFLETSQVTSLTVSVPFDSNNDSILFTFYEKILKKIGHRLQALQFHILRDCDWGLIVGLVNLCPRIHTLGINIEVNVVLSNNESVKFKNMQYIRKLSIMYEDCLENEILLDRVKQILCSAPNITTLEFYLTYTACSWIMSVAAEGLLNNVETLVLGLQFVVYVLQPDVDLYVPMIEAMTNLKRLVLVKVPDVILGHLKRIFNTSSLEITSSAYSVVAYQGHHSKFKT